MTPILEVRGLSIAFRQYEAGTRQRSLPVIRDLSLTVGAGQIVAVVGSSGSGKSLLAHGILHILPYNSCMQGEMRFCGMPLTAERAASLRGREMVLVPQGVTYLDPLMRVGPQVRRGQRTARARAKCREVLARYGLDADTENLYPFELSGGMARRVLISTAGHGNAQAHPGRRAHARPGCARRCADLGAFSGTGRCGRRHFAHHARSGACIDRCRPGGRPVRRGDRRGGSRPGLCGRPPAPSLYPGAVGGPAAERVYAHPGHAALSRGYPGGMPVCATLPALPDGVPRPGEHPIPAGGGRLCALPAPGRRLDDMSLQAISLSFSYRGRRRTAVLDQIDLTIERGER